MTNGPVIFLYNHDATHQVAHSAGIAGALATSAHGRETIAACGSKPFREEVEKLLDPEQIAALVWLDLALPPWLQLLLAPLNRLIPIRRLARLYWHRKKLRKAALIVSTERTCLTLKRHWRHGAAPRFAYIPHGSGDRNVAVHRALAGFDLCLVSGRKVVDQLVNAGVSTPEKCRIIGYAKFDILRGRKPERFFDNDRPTFLYNPHFDPHMSSWFDHGQDILQWFYERPEQYNLIFAPHVMLFLKRVHISLEYKVTRTRPDIDPKYQDAPNIRIDTDSPRLFDMSYTLAADAYIGDMSSQIYEFLYRPGPAFFIDTHSEGGTQDEPAYEFWKNGPIVHNMEQLGDLLPQWREIGERFKDEQIRLMDYTADRSDPRPASIRGAEALVSWLESPSP